MNARTSAAALALLAALTLTGCAGTADSAASGTAAPQESVTPLAAEPDTEPLTAETSTPDDANSAFLANIRENLPPNTSIPNATDDQLLSAGQEACVQIEAGVDPGAVRVVEGEQPNGADIYADSSAIMNAALLALCPELL